MDKYLIKKKKVVDDEKKIDNNGVEDNEEELQTSKELSKSRLIFVNSGGEDDEDELPEKKQRIEPLKASKTPKEKKKTLTLEQHRRRIGDAVKGCLSMEKYCMKADCHCTVKISIDIFRRLIIPHAAEVTPVEFTSTTPVVVALVKGSKAAGEIFGKTKIKGGNRYEQCEAEKMELVFFPSREKMRVWWIMYRDYRSKDSEDSDTDNLDI